MHTNVLHFTFVPGRQTQDELAAMFNYLTKKLTGSTSSSPRPQKEKNLARAYNLDNQTPLVLAVCHPNITENIVDKLISIIQFPTRDAVIHVSVDQSSEELQVLYRIFSKDTNAHKHSKRKLIPTRTPNKSQIYIETANSYRIMHRSRHFQKKQTPKSEANPHRNAQTSQKMLPKDHYIFQ